LTEAGLALRSLTRMGAVVADGVVAGVAVGERLALLAAQDGVELGEPGEVAADPAGVGAPGRRRERLALEVRAVALEPVRQVLVEASYIRADRSRSDRHPARLLLSEVLVGR